MPIFRLTVHGTLEAQEVVSVMHYIPTGIPQGGVEQLCSVFIDQVESEWTAALPAAYSTSSVKAVDIATQAMFEQAWSVTGALIGDCSSPQCAPLISFKTDLASRRGRGRLYLPGIREADTEHGLVGAAHQTRMQALGNKLMAISDGNFDFGLVIYSRVNQTSRGVIAAIVRDVVYTQRRRTVGVGS